MNNVLLQIKIKGRLNKLDSQDYDNIPCWRIIEAFNKAQVEWVRSQISGYNQRREGDESSKMLIDDLQILLKEKKLSHTEHETYHETNVVPEDYLFFKKIGATGFTATCPDGRPMKIYLDSLSDIELRLNDELTKPSFEWAETIAIFGGNRFRIFHNGEFDMKDITLTYYRLPKYVSFEGCIDPKTGNPGEDIECEFKDDIVEILVDKAAATLAYDLEIFHQGQRTQTNATSNT